MNITVTTIKSAEFKPGDEVTYKPYKKACKCKVLLVQKGMFADGKYMDGGTDNRIFYKLSGEAVTCTTGISIVESILYALRQK